MPEDCSRRRARAAVWAALLPLETWPAVVGQRADAGGGRFVRGGNFNPTNDVAT